MKSKIYKLRCRKNGVVVTKLDLKNYDIVWVREINKDVYSEDKTEFSVGEIVYDRWRNKREIVEIKKHPYFYYKLKDPYGFTVTNNVLKIK